MANKKNIFLKLILKFLLAIPFLCSINGSSQCVFNKLVDYHNMNNGGWAIIQTNDNGYISSGITYVNNYAIYLVKIDFKGDTIWSKLYDFVHGYAEDGYSIIQLPDGKYSICGVMADTANNESDSFIFTTDENGDSISLKTLEGGYGDVGVMHKRTHDGGFIIGGYYYDSTATYTNVFIIKTDSLGNEQWQKNYPDTNHTNNFRTIDLTPDGGYIIGGDFQNPVTSSWDLFLLKTDSLGNQQWKKYYGTSYSERKGYAISTLDSGFAIVGYTTYSNGDVDGYIVKTDSSGTVKWEKKYGLVSYTDVFKVIRQLPDSSYIVAGSIVDTNFTPPPPQVRFFKLDPNGDSVWTKKYSYYGFHGSYAANSHTYVEDLNLTSDGGFIATGYIINNSLPAKNDLWLLKTDSLGNTCTIDTTTYAGCWEYNCSLTHSAIAVSSDTVYLSQGATAQYTAVSNYATEWNWNFGDNSTSSAENPQHSYTATGSYTVTLIAGNGICTDTSYYTITVKLNSGIIPNDDNISIYLYPSPATTTIHVCINRNIYGNYTIILYNMQGESVKQLTTLDPETTLDISQLSQGIYTIRVLGNNMVRSERVVKK